MSAHKKNSGRGSGVTSALAGRQARILLAMRAGSMESLQLVERFGDSISSTMAGLIAQGFVVSKPNGAGFSYSLTQAGRAACPSRRQLECADEERATA